MIIWFLNNFQCIIIIIIIIYSSFQHMNEPFQGNKKLEHGPLALRPCFVHFVVSKLFLFIQWVILVYISVVKKQYELVLLKMVWSNLAKSSVLLVCGGHTVKAVAVLVGGVLLLYFEKRDDIFILWFRFLLPPGKLSVSVGVAL